MPSPSPSLLRSLALFALSAQAATAQSAALRPPDEVVSMSAFEVSATPGNDYIASESVTGTRVASKLKDLPFQVNVVTAEFMTDFAAFEMSDQLAFVSNISPSSSQGQFQLRGFASTPFVDGFRRLGSISIVNTDRVEVIKGPAASIYGQVQPGGVVNYLTKRPKTRPEHRVELAYGSNETLRATASTTGPTAGRRVSHRIDVSHQSRTFDQAFARRETRYASGVLQFRPDEATSILVKVDRNETNNRDPVRVPYTKVTGGAPSLSTTGFGNTNFTPVTDVNGKPVYYGFTLPVAVRPTASRQPIALGVATDTVVTPLPNPAIVGRYFQNPDDYAAYTAYYRTTQTAGYVSPANGTGLRLNSQLNLPSSGWAPPDHRLALLRPDGTLGDDQANLTAATLTADRRFSRVFSSRFTLDAYNRTRHRQSNNNLQPTFDELAYPDGKYGVSGPAYAVNDQNGQTAQLDTLAAFATGPVGHKLLFTLDYAAVRKRDWSLRTITAPTGTSVLRDNYTVTDNRSPRGQVKYPFVFILGPTAIANGALPYPYTDYSYSFPTYQRYPELYTERNGHVEAENTDLGFFLSERASFFRGRLLAFGGIRYDRMRNKVQDRETTGDTVRWNNHAFTHQSGLTFNVTPNLVLFANHSSTYNPNPQDKYDKATGAVEVFGNEAGRGFEYGARLSWFDSRFTIGLSRFDIERRDKLDAFTNEYGEPEYVANGRQRSRGYEVDFNLQLTSALQVLGGYGYNDAVYTQSSLPYLLGTTTPQSPKDNLGVAARYAIRTGPLRGLSVTAGVRTLSKSLLSVGSGNVLSTTPYRAAGTFTPIIYNTPLPHGSLPFPQLPDGLAILSANTVLASGTADPAGSGLRVTQVNKGYVSGAPTVNGQLAIPAGWVRWTPGQTMTAGTRYYLLDGDGQTASSYHYSTPVDDGRGSVFNDPSIVWEWGVSYTFRPRARKTAHRVGLNVKNAFDRTYTYGSGTLGDRRQLIGTYGVTF